MNGIGGSLVAVGVLLAAGCNLQEFTVNTTAPVIRDASKSFAAESDVALAREAAPAQLKAADGFLASSPKNRILLQVAAQGYLEYAFGFIEDDLEQIPDDEQHAAAREELARRATGLYDRSLGFALRLLALDDESFEAAFRKDVAGADVAAKKLERASLPGLFFAGLALASAINLNRTDLGRVIDLPKAIALVKRAYQLDPAFANGGPAMTLGIVYGSQGKSIGGDPDAARKYFDEAIAVTGGKYLLSRVMMARFYAVTTQDRPLFESTLKKVLETPAEIMPEFRLANELARRRAARYLAHADDYF